MTSAQVDEQNYSKLQEGITKSFRTSSGTRPDVVLSCIENQKYIIKDYNQCGRWFSLIVAPILVYREKKALKKLATIEGVPKVFACQDKRVLVISYLQAQVVSKTKRTINWQRFEEKLINLIESIHQSGVAHCDLRSPGNILIDETDNPAIVDFVACIFKAKHDYNPWNYLFTRACQVDYSAVEKLRLKLRPSTLDATEKQKIQAYRSKNKNFRKLSRNLRSVVRTIFSSGKK